MSGPRTASRRRASRRAARGGRRRGGRLGQWLAPVTGAIARVFSPVGRAGRAAVSGDKPLIVALLTVVGLVVVLLSGPAQSYLDHRARVEVLEMQADVLEAENSRLSSRAESLQDEGTIERLAREQQGFIRPGEVPYALVPPDVDRPQITVPWEDADAAPAPWYERAWASVQSLFGG